MFADHVQFLRRETSLFLRGWQVPTPVPTAMPASVSLAAIGGRGYFGMVGFSSPAKQPDARCGYRWPAKFKHENFDQLPHALQFGARRTGHPDSADDGRLAVTGLVG
jgi:hypothetical protein